ncbi:hypothetical protein ACVR05_02510 [Streptococcus caprae]|uniref:Aquaporin Z n=1 Tax=Streptococcus caprae TaxID=1640501 RepID=A0ABV8CW46_9STRE
MQTALHKKLQTQENYSSEEIRWLLNHIGDPDATIRDELVYQSFNHALLEQRMALGDFQWLVHEVLERDLLFFRQEEQG